MMPIALDALNEAPEAEFVQVLGPVVEHAPWVAEWAAAQRPYATTGDLLAAMKRAIHEAEPATRLSLLRGHPELQGLAARSGTMTAASVAEQETAGLHELPAERARLFDELNAAYTARHGFPFIVAVRRHGMDSLLREFRQRVDQPRNLEIEGALAEVFRVVALRLDAVVAGPDRLPVAGRLSTHVLDTANGVPAQGVGIELYETPEGSSPRLLARATTNEGGRTDTPLIADRPVPIATYELRFGLGEYYRARGAAVAEPPFLDVVPIRFTVAEPEAHYHVPLTATPWSYSTYRGS